MKASAFLMGLGVGAGIVILFAPRSGDETRQIISGKVEEGRRYVKERMEDLRGRARETMDRGKETLVRQTDAVASAAEGAKEIYESVSQGQKQFP